MTTYESFKAVILGDTTVGKTSLCNMLVRNIFKEHYDTTIGGSYMHIKTNNYSIGLWDTAGQERYNSLISFYYRNSNIYLLVYDMSNISSLGRVLKLLEIIKNEINDNTFIYLIGNKCDLIELTKNDINNARQEFETIMDNFNITCTRYYVYTSAKTSSGITELYDSIIKNCDYLYNGKMGNNMETVNTIKFDNDKIINDNKNGCYCIIN